MAWNSADAGARVMVRDRGRSGDLQGERLHLQPSIDLAMGGAFGHAEGPVESHRRQDQGNSGCDLFSFWPGQWRWNPGQYRALVRAVSGSARQNLSQERAG